MSSLDNEASHVEFTLSRFFAHIVCERERALKCGLIIQV